MKLLDGKLVSQKLRDQLKKQISKLHPNLDKPHLAVVLVGDNQSSKVYIKQKEKACLEVGIKFTLYQMTSNVDTSDILSQIDQINNDPLIHGLIVQLPLPKNINKDLVISRISAQKDVDGFHPENIGKLLLNKNTFKPATPYGIELLIKHYQIPTQGQHCVILGKSLIVGQPLANLMCLETGLGATVTCCDKNTKNMREIIKMADILVVAVGKHHLINDANWLKPNVVIIDVGIHKINDKTKKRGFRLEGDVDFHNPSIQDKCAYMTPVPGGVGPMTVAGLLQNTYQGYQEQKNGKM